MHLVLGGDGAVAGARKSAAREYDLRVCVYVCMCVCVCVCVCVCLVCIWKPSARECWGKSILESETVVGAV